MSGDSDVRLRGHHGPNVNQSPERASASLNLPEKMSTRSRDLSSSRSRDITDQERERYARSASQGGSRSSSDTLTSGGTREEPENHSTAPSAATNSRSRRSPFDVLIRTWQSFWTANRGVILVIFAMFFAAVTNLTTKLLVLKHDHGKAEPMLVLFLRWALISVLGSINPRYLNLPLGAKGVRLALVLRGLGSSTGAYGLYYSLQYLPLAGATVITSLVPPLGIFLSYWIMDISYDIRVLLAGLVSCTGTILIAQSSSLSTLSKVTAQPVKSNSAEMIDIFRLPTKDACLPSGEAASVWSIFAVIFAVIGSVVAFCSSIWIGKRVQPLKNNYYFVAIGAVISAVYMFCFSEDGFRSPANGLEYTYLILVSVTGYITQFLFAKGIQGEKTMRPVSMMHTQLLFALGFDMMFLDVSPEAVCIAGAVLVLVSTVYVAMLPKKGQSAEDELYDDLGGSFALMESGDVQ